LPNNKENSYSAILQKFLHLNQPLVAVVAVSVPAAGDPPRVEPELTRQDCSRSAAYPNPDRIQIMMGFITVIRDKKKNGHSAINEE
jgi:hypothetical protein